MKALALFPPLLTASPGSRTPICPARGLSLQGQLLGNPSQACFRCFCALASPVLLPGLLCRPWSLALAPLLFALLLYLCVCCFSATKKEEAHEEEEKKEKEEEKGGTGVTDLLVPEARIRTRFFWSSVHPWAAQPLNLQSSSLLGSWLHRAARNLIWVLLSGTSPAQTPLGS